MTITILSQDDQLHKFFAPAVEVVLNTLSPLSAQIYGPIIREFLDWWSGTEQPNPVIAVTSYRAHLLEQGLAAVTVNKKLSAIRKLFRKAAQIGIIPYQVGDAVREVENIPVHGKIYGRRVGRDVLGRLLDFVDTSNEFGKRDYAILCLLILCGLRRSEVCGLLWSQMVEIPYIDQRITVLQNIRGKHGRVRTVPLPSRAEQALRQMINFGNSDEHIFRSMKPSGTWRSSITPQGIYKTVLYYAQKAGVELTPHDLRRSFAHVMRFDQGASLEDIQKFLGHASPVTTGHYVGEQDNLQEMAEKANFLSPIKES